ncbi:MAG: serpin family protein [Synergistaceae bacterium]|nr:serpin family protein [Synergistaceae bacterium]
MKKLLVLITILSVLVTAMCASADTSKLIPPYHWTYHSLETLHIKGLLDEEVVPGKSAFNAEQVVSMVVMALDTIERDPLKMGQDELLSMRQLINGYKSEFIFLGYDFNKIRTDLEDCAIRAGLTAVETGALSARPAALSKKAAGSVNGFALGLYKNLSEKETGNLFFSPYSISAALAASYAGARGSTAAEMENVLYLDPDIHRSMSALISELNSVSDDIAEMDTANAIWPAKQEKLLADYVDTVKNYYGAALIPLNYRASPEKARKTINKWVEKQTHEKIKDLIGVGVLKKDTQMVLTNAVYFRSDWLEKFEAGDSRVMPFWVANDRSIPTLMMNKTSDRINYAKISGTEIAELPYKDGRFSMLVILPDKATGLKSAESNLSLKELDSWIKSMSLKKVSITIPKFKMEQSFELSEALGQMGMPSAFSPDKADFSGMNGKYNMYIGSVIHKAFIEVGEEGTEAAAATAVIMMKTSLQPHGETIIFRADRPFIFMIRDNRSGAILFIGRYAKP